ncbi:2-amino-4-oxopentanoate thiolase subunit OrtB [Methylomarinum sp. Ch1-1]|uniref:cysteine synthase n=1 Tax=Methylomarinum roseum TaxID=3067653 RepID=A0AAU7NQD6_9GAMM|nr:2-amino-4-oxopentanoate thiolase subunit OrtB [Methylomarinum sp. Ch1-1]MDP4520875.1 2-amino-4-oxopentanoate thiolase subunit OrtB [Methylomarinum sp. Ch1-1]
MHSYQAVMDQRNDIMRQSVGIDYRKYATGVLAFDYQRLMDDTGYRIDRVREVQGRTAVGNTPLVELKNLTRLARRLAKPGYGARLFVKDEAANPSGSFKDRRASLSVFEAKRRGYPGVIAATSGNYGAAIASQAAKAGLRCIIVQEAFDSRGVAQPEIAEKTRACEAYGAEVMRLSVGPELFYQFLRLLKETGYFNASLYTPYSIQGIETLGFELAEQILDRERVHPDAVVVTHAGGGNLTGTARGLIEAGAGDTEIIAASVDLTGLHMASDHDFNRKSFTTGHTGFSLPFTTWPDRADVPRNAARALRYMDRFVTVTQGEVFYITQALAELEGLERGPAGNTSLAAAFVIAQQLTEDRIVVVQETEYTGAGKHPLAQLNLAKRMGVAISRGDPKTSKPGQSIVIPESPEQLAVADIDLMRVRRSYLQHALQSLEKQHTLTETDYMFLAAETRLDITQVKEICDEYIGQAR